MMLSSIDVDGAFLSPNSMNMFEGIQDSPLTFKDQDFNSTTMFIDECDSCHTADCPEARGLSSPQSRLWMSPSSNQILPLSELYVKALRKQRTNSAGFDDQLRAPVHQTPNFCTPLRSRSCSLLSKETVEVDDDYINWLYAKRDELSSKLERLRVDLLRLLYEEWTITGVIPDEYEKACTRLGRSSQRLKNTSFPMRHLMAHRSSTFSHPSVLSSKPRNNPLLNQRSIDRPTERPTGRFGILCPMLQSNDQLPVHMLERSAERVKESVVPDHSFTPTELSLLHTADASTSVELRQGEYTKPPPANAQCAKTARQKLLPSSTSIHHYDDDMDIERAAVELKLCRLEVDYAVVNHLREIHKQKAVETKRDAYKIAYKANSRKLKEIVSEMAQLKAQLTDCCQFVHGGSKNTKLGRRVVEPRKSLKHFWSKKHNSVASIPYHSSRESSPVTQISSSTPVTPIKLRCANKNPLQQARLSIISTCSNDPHSVIKRDQYKQSRRPSLMPLLRIFNPSRRSVKPNENKLSSIAPVKLTRTQVQTLGHEDTHSVHYQLPIESPLCGLPEQRTGQVTKIRNTSPADNGAQNPLGQKLESTELVATMSDSSSKLSELAFLENQVVPVWNVVAHQSRTTSISHALTRSHSMPEHLDGILCPLSSGWKPSLKPVSTTSATEFNCNPFCRRSVGRSPETLDNCIRASERSAKLNQQSQAIPKRLIATASNTSSSNWSTSGCSCMSSNTAESVSPENSRHSAKIWKTNSAPALGSGVLQKSTSLSPSTTGCIQVDNGHKSCLPNPPERGAAPRIIRVFRCVVPAIDQAGKGTPVDGTPLNRQCREKLLDNENCDDEGYARCSDTECEMELETHTISHVTRLRTPVSTATCDATLVESRSVSPSPTTVHRISKNIVPDGSSMRRTSLRPFTLIRRAVSRMSSRRCSFDGKVTSISEERGLTTHEMPPCLTRKPLDRRPLRRR